jgi:uncharacterized protein YecT (DUF1311 family)
LNQQSIHIDLQQKIQASGAAIVIASSASAQAINCKNPRGGYGEKECDRLTYVAADKRLKQIYTQIVSTLTGKEKQTLMDAQLSWI